MSVVVENALRQSASSVNEGTCRVVTRRGTDPVPVNLPTITVKELATSLDQDFLTRSVAIGACSNDDDDEDTPPPPTTESPPAVELKRNRLAPLAEFSSLGSNSPSPRESTPATRESAPPELTPRQRLVSSGKRVLQKLTHGKKVEATLPRSQSLPCSPRQFVFSTERTTFDPAPAPRAPIENFFDALRSCESDESSTEALGIKGSASEKKKRHSMLIAAASGSLQFGASGTIEFDSVTNTPTVRVQPHATPKQTSRLQFESDKSSSSDSLRKSSSSSGGKPKRDSDDSSGSTSPSMLRRRSSSSKTLGLTYSIIEYNPDPLGIGPWQRFIVPNVAIDSDMRKFLACAAHSEQSNRAFRPCECSPGCMRHPSPDAVSKLAAVFVVDPTFMATTDSLRAALNAFLKQYNTGKTRMRPGEWAANYLVKDATETNFEKTPCTYHYRYKRFL